MTTQSYVRRPATQHLSMLPIPANIVPLPQRLPTADVAALAVQPLAVQRMLEATICALAHYGFTAMHTDMVHRRMDEPLGGIAVTAFRQHCETTLTLTIADDRRWGLLAVGCWTMVDDRRMIHRCASIGFELDADTTSVALAARLARTLANYERRKCIPSLSDMKRAV